MTTTRTCLTRCSSCFIGNRTIRTKLTLSCPRGIGLRSTCHTHIAYTLCSRRTWSTCTCPRRGNKTRGTSQTDTAIIRGILSCLTGFTLFIHHSKSTSTANTTCRAFRGGHRARRTSQTRPIPCGIHADRTTLTHGTRSIGTTACRTRRTGASTHTRDITIGT